MADATSSTPPLTPSTLHDRYGLLRVYAYYRLILAALLSILFFSQWTTNLLGISNPVLFRYTLVLYTIITVITLIRIHRLHLEPTDEHLFLVFFIDIVAVSLLMHCSDGVSSGLGLLLVVTVSAASITLYGQLSTLIAALAALIILSSAFYNALLDYDAHLGDLLSAGLIGFLLFVTSQLFAYITRRMQIAANEAELQTRRRVTNTTTQ